MTSPAHRSRLAWRIAGAVVLGIGAGELLGTHAEVLGDIAIQLIQILKTLAAPLVFFAVAEACSRIPLRWAQARRLLTISVTNACVAGLIAIGVDRIFPLGSTTVVALRNALGSGTAGAPKPMTVSVGTVLESLVPKSVVQPFADNQVIGAVVLAVLAGLALRSAKAGGAEVASLQTVDDFISGALRILMIGIGWIVDLVPFAVFGVLARIVGHSGLAPLRSLGPFLAIIVVGFVLQGAVYYALLLKAIARVDVARFFRNASDALLTAMATGSSLATLPVTLRVLQEKMGIRPENARLAAMVGTNLNHDGILLYEAATALFLARILGIPLGASQSVAVVAISALAAFGIAGIPDAGLLTLSLVLPALKLPLAAIPLFLPLDWLIGRMRATLNVTSDLVVAHLLQAWERRDEVPEEKLAGGLPLG